MILRIKGDRAKDRRHRRRERKERVGESARMTKNMGQEGEKKC